MRLYVNPIEIINYPKTSASVDKQTKPHWAEEISEQNIHILKWTQEQGDFRLTCSHLGWVCMTK